MSINTGGIQQIAILALPDDYGFISNGYPSCFVEDYSEDGMCSSILMTEGIKYDALGANLTCVKVTHDGHDYVVLANGIIGRSDCMFSILVEGGCVSVHGHILDVEHVDPSKGKHHAAVYDAIGRSITESICTANESKRVRLQKDYHRTARGIFRSIDLSVAIFSHYTHTGPSGFKRLIDFLRGINTPKPLMQLSTVNRLGALVLDVNVDTVEACFRVYVNKLLKKIDRFVTSSRDMMSASLSSGGIQCKLPYLREGVFIDRPSNVTDPSVVVRLSVRDPYVDSGIEYIDLKDGQTHNRGWDTVIRCSVERDIPVGDEKVTCVILTCTHRKPVMGDIEDFIATANGYFHYDDTDFNVEYVSVMGSEGSTENDLNSHPDAYVRERTIMHYEGMYEDAMHALYDRCSRELYRHISKLNNEIKHFLKMCDSVASGRAAGNVRTLPAYSGLLYERIRHTPGMVYPYRGDEGYGRLDSLHNELHSHSGEYTQHPLDDYAIRLTTKIHEALTVFDNFTQAGKILESSDHESILTFKVKIDKRTYDEFHAAEYGERLAHDAH